MVLTKLKTWLVAGALAAAGAVALAMPVGAVSCPSDALRGEAPTLAECNIAEEDNDLMAVINDIINVIVGVVAIISVVAIILGGLNYVLAAGDPTKLKRAKDIIVYAVVGLVISVLAFAIVNFVLKSVFSGGSSASDGGTDNKSTSSETTSVVMLVKQEKLS